MAPIKLFAVASQGVRLGRNAEYAKIGRIVKTASASAMLVRTQPRSPSSYQPELLPCPRSTSRQTNARQQGSARIIFTTSKASVLARDGIHGYVASKSGLDGLTRSLACELGQRGITCNSICPGSFETVLTSSIRSSSCGSISRVPPRRWGQPRDLTVRLSFLHRVQHHTLRASKSVVDGGTLSHSKGHLKFKQMSTTGPSRQI